MTKKIIALLLFVSTITLAQEKVLLRLNYEKGDSYTMNMKMAQVMGMGVMTNDMNIQMKYDITNVSDDTYESTAKYTKMAMDMKQGAMQVSYDSTKKEEELDDTGKMMKSQMKPMLEATIFMKGDRMGTILETKAEPNFQGAEKITDQSNSVVYPENAVAVGDTWTMNKNKDGMSLDFTYKVKSISSKNVLLDVSGKVSGVADGNITGSIDIDRKSGILTESKINMTMKIQGQDLTTNMVVNQFKN
ncbi:DUF6263 family protein [Tenacibaculum caenipelagi]|uniref:Uncharacterized protein n=1 Tax=Tenacibaculum caenipelagi TaxID=1325435 RepID=A0A4R6TNM7_9FLAO|nr:DUF6263 family protein [Tenacibaculum caenipelagi]TDQ29879.1 hypothetical protein DFQ07_0203 [Tenacibaculum caenipelagi]